jgi:hypothetical protein
MSLPPHLVAHHENGCATGVLPRAASVFFDGDVAARAQVNSLIDPATLRRAPARRPSSQLMVCENISPVPLAKAPRETVGLDLVHHPGGGIVEIGVHAEKAGRWRRWDFP